jgi:hypothetical protein
MEGKNERDNEAKKAIRKKRARLSRKRNRSIAGRDAGVNQCKNRFKWLTKRVILEDDDLREVFAKGDVEGGGTQLKLRFENGGADKDEFVDGVNYYLNHVERRLLGGISNKMATMGKAQRKADGLRKRVSARVSAQHVLAVACNILPSSLAEATKVIFDRARKEVQAKDAGAKSSDVGDDAHGESRPKYRSFSLSTAPIKHAFRQVCGAYMMGEFAPLAIIAVEEAVLRRMMLLGLKFLTGQWVIPAFSKAGKLQGHGDVTLGIRHLFIAANYDRPPYTSHRGLAAILASNEYGVRYIPVEHCSAIGTSKYRPELSWSEDVEAYRRSVKKARSDAPAVEVN